MVVCFGVQAGLARLYLTVNYCLLFSEILDDFIFELILLLEVSFDGFLARLQLPLIPYR